VRTRHGYPNRVAATKLVFDIVTASTTAKLADGRDLLFFALPGHCPAPVEDRRPLPARAATRSQLRFDRSTGQWVIIAVLRQDRTYKPLADQCPPCRTHRGPRRSSIEVVERRVDPRAYPSRVTELLALLVYW